MTWLITFQRGREETRRAFLLFRVSAHPLWTIPQADSLCNTWIENGRAKSLPKTTNIEGGNTQ